MSFIVGIDGPAGSGKGTVTKKVANKMGLINIDTGSTYRCVALEALNRNIVTDLNAPICKEKIIPLLDEVKIEIENTDTGDKVYLNGKEVTKEIRSKEVTKIVSPISSIKEVRYKMVELQRRLALGKNVIMEGRDICTNVFPNADVKIYLDATLEERANRRFLEFKERGIETSYEEVINDIKKRDHNDKNKEIGSLKLTKDSIIIDSTNSTIEEVVNIVIEIINKKREENK